MSILGWIKHIFYPTVGEITADFDKIVVKLKNAEQRSAKALNFHQRMTSFHSAEQAAAARIGLKIKELIS